MNKNYETVYNGIKTLFTDPTKKSELIKEVKVYLLNKNGTLKKKFGSRNAAWSPLSNYVFSWITEQTNKTTFLSEVDWEEIITHFIDNTHLGCSYSNQFDNFFSIKNESVKNQEKIKKIFDDFSESFFEKYVKKA